MEAAKQAGAGRALALAALTALVLAALLLRTRDLEAFRIGPDDGSYLHSARIDGLERGGSPLEWVRDDVAWAQELARLYADETQTYQHSYLHQLTARWLYRAGAGALVSLRLSSALTGTLTVLIAAWLLARVWPAGRRWALLAAACVALSPLHAFYSRAGWGQAGMTCFYLVYAGLAWDALVRRDERDRRGLALSALGMAAASLLAFGWQEGVAPFVAGTGIVALLAPWVRGERWSARAVLCSPRTLAVVAGSAPVGLLTLALLLWSPFAQDYWFRGGGRAQLPWLELKRASLQDLFVTQRLDLQLTWVALALALLGLLHLWRRARAAARYLVATALAGSLLLVLLFGDAFLLRAYLPAQVLVLLLSAAGLAAIHERLGQTAGALAAAGALALLAATSFTSLFGRVEQTLFVQKLYARSDQLDHRHVDRALLEHLLAHRRPEERVAVFGDKAAIYRLLDRGIRAREDYLEGPEQDWPHWIVGATNVTRTRPFFAEPDGAYREVARDAVGRHALYERRGP